MPIQNDHLKNAFQMTWREFGETLKSSFKKATRGNEYCHWSSSVDWWFASQFHPNLEPVEIAPSSWISYYSVVEGNCFFSHSQKHVEERRQSQMEAWRCRSSMQKRLKSQTTSESRVLKSSEEAKCQFLNFFLFCHITKKGKKSQPFCAMLCKILGLFQEFLALAYQREIVHVISSFFVTSA